MIIAQLRFIDGGKGPGTVYLASTPFPGDTIATAGGQTLMVIRRTFLDLGPNAGTDSSTVMSVRLEVRPV